MKDRLEDLQRQVEEYERTNPERRLSDHADVSSSSNASSSSSTVLGTNWAAGQELDKTQDPEDHQYARDYNNFIRNVQNFGILPQTSLSMVDSSIGSPMQALPMSNLELSFMAIPPSDPMQTSPTSYHPAMNTLGLLRKRNHRQMQVDTEDAQFGGPETGSSSKMTSIHYQLPSGNILLEADNEIGRRPASSVTSRENTGPTSCFPNAAETDSLSDLDIPSQDATVEERFE